MNIKTAFIFSSVLLISCGDSNDDPTPTQQTTTQQVTKQVAKQVTKQTTSKQNNLDTPINTKTKPEIKQTKPETKPVIKTPRVISNSNTNIPVCSNKINTLQNAYNYHNSYIRKQAGLNLLTRNPLLEKASNNHAHYSFVNNIKGHAETEGKQGFTGVKSSDRANHVGYKNRMVMENISYRKNVILSIESLMSAIYHRFGLLDMSMTDIGIGFHLKDDECTANLIINTANNKINDLCEAGENFTYGRYFYRVCHPDIKIAAEKMIQAENSTTKKNPKIIIWPIANQKDVPTTFYEETPDPLPDYSISGYPVSIEFNPIFTKEVKVTDFKLYKGSTEITNVRYMDKQKDPNQKFTEYQFALFPLDRLEKNTTYTAKVAYIADGNQQTKTWLFTTKR